MNCCINVTPLSQSSTQLSIALNDIVSSVSLTGKISYSYKCEECNVYKPAITDGSLDLGCLKQWPVLSTVLIHICKKKQDTGLKQNIQTSFYIV